MSYAIVDIETTGGYAGANGITEIAIILFDGSKTEGKFHTLINPGIPVPRYISSLTGITNEMLYDQPSFEKVAGNIYNLLEGRIFVAHNVNFDYSFIKHHLAACGYSLNSRKLCTVRLSRKIFPGYARYNLGAICRELEIPLKNAHRAFGDATATAELFERLLNSDNDGHIAAMLKGKNREQYLPMHVPVEQIDQLPSLPGVYYFHDRSGKIVYVGKAANLQKRIKSHFSNNDVSRRKQDFIKTICGVTHKVCGTELMALVLENVEIRRLWPQYNRSQKRFSYTYGLYSFTARNGYRMLAIEKKKNRLEPVYTFNNLQDGYCLLKKLVNTFSLHTGLCFIDTSKDWKVEEDPH
ncbi:MAG: GIY-YIG nuclease family protein, partial [Chitinophagaceae bacterium]|nr:GIY-YIG nuclease family protein [Chitinophagaceae bacterium]